MPRQPNDMTPEQTERYIKALELIALKMDRLITAVVGLTKKLGSTQPSKLG